jgi:hypothetical protein
MRLSPYFKGSEHVYYLPIELKMDKPREFKELVINSIT